MALLLWEKGWEVSTSVVGRILTRLKERGVLREPLRSGISTRKGLWQRPYAVRKPREYQAREPGDIVQKELLAWEHTYNTIRPHQALAYLTPHQFVPQWQRQRKESKCH